MNFAIMANITERRNNSSTMLDYASYLNKQNQISTEKVVEHIERGVFSAHEAKLESRTFDE